MIILSWEEWKDVTRLEEYFSKDEQRDREMYKGYVSMQKEKILHVKQTGGYPNCHCNHCIEDIEEFQGFRLYDEYNYKGQNVYIRRFHPLENYCLNIFVSGKGTGFSEWLSVEDAKRLLTT